MSCQARTTFSRALNSTTQSITSKITQRESQRLRDLIDRVVPGARTLLDVACGSGAHAKLLKDYYAVDGIDLNNSYLEAARTKNPSGKYYCADMTDFDLGARYDVVTCLFSLANACKSRVRRRATPLGRR
jgi:2-polyprenyl-3-methyl-5-hydroxy-6-metoxy-1,4-benzoquinol methylase